MKIAFVNQPWTPASTNVGADSIGIWTNRVACRLVNFCEVVVYGKKTGRGHKLEKIEGIEYRPISSIPDRLLNKLLASLGSIAFINNNSDAKRPYFASTLSYIGYILQIANDLKKQNCDVVHIHQFSQFVPIIRWFNPSIKIVLHMNCEWLSQLDRTMIARRLEYTDLIIGSSDYITEKIQNRFPQFSNRCQTIYNGVDSDYFVRKSVPKVSPNASSFNLLFVGRVSPEKAIHILLDAFCEVVVHYPKTHLKIVGPEAIAPKEYIIELSDDPKIKELLPFYSDSYVAQLKNRIPESLSDRVHFAGAVSHDHILDYYENATILINPSFSESFGMSLAEAMAMEVPAIGANIGGMVNVVKPEETGLLVESGNVSDLAKAIMHLLSDEELRISMGKAGRQRVLERFSWDKIAEKSLFQYQRICAN
jgi:spore coat protein SA